MIYVEEHGQGPAVALVHGMPTTVDVFDPLVSALTKRNRVLVVHLPGYGKSPAASEPYDWSKVQRSLGDVLRAKARGRSVLVGFSGGAYRALGLALDKALDVAGLVLLGGYAELDAAEVAGMGQLTGALRAGVDLSGVVAPRFLASRLNDPEAVASVRGWTKAIAPAALASELDAAVAAPSLMGRLGELAVPVLLRVGERDVACPPAKSEAIAAKLSKAKLEVAPGAGHALFLEDTDATVASVERFVRECL